MKMKLKPTKSYKINKTQNHGRWISYSELEEVVNKAKESAEQKAIEDTCKLMLVVGVAVVQNDIGKLFRNKDERVKLWCMKTLELMGHADSFTEEMKAAKLELVESGLLKG